MDSDLAGTLRSALRDPDPAVAGAAALGALTHKGLAADLWADLCSTFPAWVGGLDPKPCLWIHKGQPEERAAIITAAVAAARAEVPAPGVLAAIEGALSFLSDRDPASPLRENSAAMLDGILGTLADGGPRRPVLVGCLRNHQDLPEVFEVLLLTSRDQDPEVRAATFRVLDPVRVGWLADDEEIRKKIALIFDCLERGALDPDPRVRREVAQNACLGRAPRLLPTLARLAADPDPVVSTAAVRMALNHVLIHQQAGRPANERDAALLSRVVERAVSRGRAKLHRHEAPGMVLRFGQVARAVARRIVQGAAGWPEMLLMLAGEGTGPVMLHELVEEEVPLPVHPRNAGACALRAAASRSPEELEALSAHPHPEVCLWAARSLALRFSEESREVLVRLARTSPNPQVRAVAVRALCGVCEPTRTRTQAARAGSSQARYGTAASPFSVPYAQFFAVPVPG